MAESHKPCQQSPTPSAAAAGAGGATLAGLPPPRLLRSPSHESVSTELSLFSISSAASEMSRAGLRVVLPPHLGRGPSPTPETRHRLQVSSQVSPNIHYPLSPSSSASAAAASWLLRVFLLLAVLLLLLLWLLVSTYVCMYVCTYVCVFRWDASFGSYQSESSFDFLVLS